MDERELERDLSRMIRGELASSEVKRLVLREGFASFSELCESHLPEDLGKVRLGTRDVLARIDRFRRGAIDLYELWFWADELYNISFNHRIAYEARGEELITTALSALGVVANERLFRNREKLDRSLDYIRACLLRRKKLELRRIFMRIFEDLEVAHLAVRRAPGERRDEDARFADVVLLDRPWQPDTDLYADYSWMIAFTVAARSLYEEERAEDAAAEGEDAEEGDWVCPECERRRRERADGRAEAGAGEGEPFSFAIPGWTEPEADDEADGCSAAEDAAAFRARPRPSPGEEIDRMPALRRLAPNFDVGRRAPRYLYDGDGIAEVVLDVPAIGPAEVLYATKLFCLANRIRAARLEGERVKALVVKPGAGKRA